MSYSSYRLRVFVLFLLTLPVLITISSSIRAEAADVSLEQDLQSHLLSSKAVIASAEDKLNRGDSIVTEINRLKSLSKDIHILHLLLIESFELRKARIAILGTKASLRHSVMIDGYMAAIKEYLSLIESLSAEALLSIEELEQLKALLEKNLSEKKRPIFGVLPYKSLHYSARELVSEPVITPAYKGGATIASGGTMNPVPEDFEGTLEAPITAEIATLAQLLNWNPVSIYEYVKNNIDTQWYWGCMKGSEETLSQQSGNDCDQSALLVALYRAAGFRTRYIRGVIKFFPGIDSARNLTGLEDPEQMAELFQKAGIPFTPVIEGGRIANFLIEHIWMEVYVPYANYRGAMLDDHGYEWVALDTSIKVKKYAENIPPEVFEDFLQANPLAGFRESYLESINSETPLEFLKTSIQGYLDVNNPGMTYEELLGTRTLTPEVMNILPMGLQFEPIAITGEYTVIPDDLIHKVRFIANDSAGNLLLDITLSALEVSNQPVVLTYEAETVEDHEIIISYGGLDNTPAYLVRLRPVLKVGGERIIVAKGGLPMGSEYEVIIEFTGPNGTERITNTHVTGNLSVMGIVSQETVDSGGAEENTEENAASLLYQSAISYISRWNHAEAELASLMHLKIVRPIPTVVTLGGVIDISYLLDTPHGFTWKGVYLDADLRTVEIVDNSQNTISRDKGFMQLSGLQGSVLESRVFEDDFQVESISTAKLLAIAGESGTPILTIDSANIDTLLPTLPFAANIQEDIINSVNQGFIISIPESEITYENWTGTGYIKENPFSGESGWMLSGMIAGSMSAGEWVKQYLKDILSRPYNEASDSDPMSAARVIKISVTDRQFGTVGQAIKKPLSVLVLTRDDIPVIGVQVTFKVIAGNGSFNGSDTYTSQPTGRDGIAEVEAEAFTLGEKTSENSNYMKDSSDEYVTQIGLNLITASVSGYRGAVWINEPFELYGQPDKPSEIVKVFGDGGETFVNNPAGSLLVKVQDKYGNPISNETVTFTALNAMQRPMWPDGQTALQYIYFTPLDHSLYLELADKFYDYMSPVSPDDIASYLNSIASGLWNKEILPYLTSNCRNITFYRQDECEVEYPLYGECITQGDTECIIALDDDGNSVVERKAIEVTSRYYGATVNTMLGNTVGTKYTVEVSSTTLEPVYFNLYTRGSRKSDVTDQFKFMGNAVFIGGFEIFNENGEPVNAAKSGEELQAPLRTRLFVLHDEYTMEVGTAGYCPDLWRLRSLQTVKIEPASKGIVTYTPVAGGGRVVEAINAGNGFYEARYETGTEPAVNRIDATGEATVTLPEVLSSYDEEWGLSIYRCYNSSTLPDRKVAVKTGQVVTFEWDTKEPYFYYDSNIVDTRVTNTVYGVDFAPCRNTDTNICAEEPGEDIKLDPGVVLLNEEGHTTTDTTFRYTILPPEYNAVSSDIDLYEIDETTGESWHGSLVGSSTRGEGGSVLVAGAKMFDVDKKYEAQVVLNRGSAAEIKSKRVEVKVAELKFLVDHDGKLRWNDYYPVLGSKIITVLAVDKALEGKTVTCIAEIAGVTCKALDEARFTDSKVQFKLSGTNLTESQKTIPLTFQALNDDGIQLAGISATYTVKDNSNTTLEEVLAGEAVFVQDCFKKDDVLICKSQGEYEPELPDDQKKFYFVQELLNQVVPRKRGVTYDLLGEDGYYGGKTSVAVSRFKAGFNINVNTNVNNLTDTFRKLMKDYELEGSQDDYLDRIIDKETLVGKVQRTGERTTKDVLVNDSATDDTGLYELYKNVVEKFIQSLIHLAESYKQNSDPTNASTQWVARTSQVQKTSDTTNQAVSYSYGGRQTIRKFNDSVAQYGAPSSIDLSKENVKTYITGYRGNIGDPPDGDDNELHIAYGLIGAGIDKWPGLIDVEWKEWANLGIFDANHQYYPGHWAGIDCIGLTLHGLRYANDPTNNAANQYLNDAGDAPIPGINFGRGCMNKDCSDMVAITSNRALANISVKKFFNSRNTELVHYWRRTAAKTKLIRKGDFIRYGSSHISIVYSDRPTCKEDEKGKTTCTYEIIHVYGGDDDRGMYKYPDIPEAAANRNKRIFGRKVIRTWNNIANPTGFSRLKLWN